MGFWLKTRLMYDSDHKRVLPSQSFPDLVAPRMFYISGAYIDMVYVRSYNVRYMKMYSTEICAYIDICLIENTWFALVLKSNFRYCALKFLRGHNRHILFQMHKSDFDLNL